MKCFFLKYSKCNHLLIKSESSPGRVIQKGEQRKSKTKLNISLRGRQVNWLNKSYYLPALVFLISAQKNEKKRKKKQHNSTWIWHKTLLNRWNLNYTLWENTLGRTSSEIPVWMKSSAQLGLGSRPDMYLASKGQSNF